MEININKILFTFEYNSKIEFEKNTVTITEPGFKEDKTKKLHHFNSPAFFPLEIEKRILHKNHSQTITYQDNQKLLKLITKFYRHENLYH